MVLLMKDNNDLVVKSNSLATASYTLTVSEFRILQMIFAEVSKEKSSDVFDASHEFRVYAKDYASLFKLSDNTAYESLKDSANRLFNRYFSFYVLARKEDIKLRWVQKVIYSEDNGYIGLQLTNDVLAMVGRSSCYFTKYKIKQITGLTSIYALKLYEIISSYSGMGGKTPIIKINELRGVLGVDKDEYTRMDNFKARVMDIAVNQINEHTNYQIKYHQHKKGRSIYGFSFSFLELKEKIVERDPNTIDWVEEQPQEKPKRKKISEYEAGLLANPGEEWPDLLKRIGSKYQVVFNKENNK